MARTRSACNAHLSLFKSNASLCDKWHPSLETICKPWSAGHEDCRRMLYAYFTAVICYIEASPRLPSIENAITNRKDPSIPVSPVVKKDTPNDNRTMAFSSLPTWKQERSVHSPGKEQDMSLVHNKLTNPNRNKSADPNKNKSAERNARPRLPAREVMQSAKPSHLNNEGCGKDHFASSPFLLAKTASIIDLTASDSEDNVKSESVMVPQPVPVKQDDHQPIPLAKQKLLDKLQSRKADEIEDMLAKRAGLLPDWIVKTMREEMEKKMSRDLEAIENWI